MHRPMQSTSAPSTGHPQAMAAGPPAFQPLPKVVKQPARIEMIENEMAKLENPDQDRFSSCLYPISASRFSSSLRDERSTDSCPITSDTLPPSRLELAPPRDGQTDWCGLYTAHLVRSRPISDPCRAPLIWA